MDVHVLNGDALRQKFTNDGTVSLPPVASLYNAIYAATGRRIRKLPIDLKDPDNT